MAKKKKQKLPEKKTNMTWVYAGLAIIIIAALAVYFYSGSSSGNKTDANLSTGNNTVEKLPTSGKYGTLSKPSTYEPGKVKMTEFLKFNCGHCYALNQQLPDIKKKYGDRLEITYKPMLWRTVATDKGFEKSIEAYILAERMGKGEEMKDALFKALFVDQIDLTSEIALGEIGKSVGLGDDFIAALKNGDAKDEAEADITLAESIPVDETPTVIINGNLKVNPSLTNEDMTLMTNNLDTIIGSLLS
jgi:thiol:disulfide interchange protein DsbA